MERKRRMNVPDPSSKLFAVSGDITSEEALGIHTQINSGPIRTLLGLVAS